MDHAFEYIIDRELLDIAEEPGRFAAEEIQQPLSDFIQQLPPGKSLRITIQPVDSSWQE